MSSHSPEPEAEPARPASSAPAPPGRPRPSRRTFWLLVGPLIALTIVGTIGNALFPALLEKHPLLLITLDARNRQLILASGKVDLWPFVVVGVLRRILSDPLYYLLGRFYGDDAVRWIERQMGEGGGVVRGVERAFRRVAPLMVFAFPGQLVCVLAGATGMSPVAFLALNFAGTVAVVFLLRRFGDAFEGPVGAVTGFMGDHWKWLTAGSITLTALWERQQPRAGGGELEAARAL